MKRIIEIKWFAWLFLLFAGSCTQAEVEGGDVPVYALKEVEVGFRLNVLASRPPVTRSVTFTREGTLDRDSLVAGEEERPVTRAAQSLEADQESKIAGVWVGQYDASTGELLFNKYFSTLTDNTVNIKLKQSADGLQSRVWFIANVGDLGEIGTEKALKEQVLPYASTATGLPESNLCGMTGMWEGVVQEGGVKNITVELTRLLAKISFTYSIGGEVFSFTPASVTLKSVPEKSQVATPESQLAGMTYGEYSGTADESGAKMYWYLPENMAGTPTGENAVDSEKKKTGKGVINATYIKLTGTAVQSGVTYEDVSFCFYPSSKMENYNIERNCFYTMNVTLMGIDISDERIKVGKIPPIVVPEGNMPAEKGGTKEVQITARPGQSWSFDLEEWLSAVINGKDAGTGAQVSYQGPAKVIFQAVSSNPKAEERSVSFSVNVNNSPQTITITQDGSTLTKGNDISLGAASGSEGSSSFKVTKGLSWQAAVSGEDWWDWADNIPVISGNEFDGNDLSLKIKSLSSNPLAQKRTGKITVTAGESTGSSYEGLKGVITVSQAASTVEGSTVELEPVAADNQSSSFTATSGLDWEAKVTSGEWLSLTGTTSGSSTSGSAQDITFNVKVNPTASPRSEAITVRAGDKTGGPTGVITVKQKASSLTASINPTTVLAATAGVSGTYTMNGTKGLTYSFPAGFPSWLTVMNNGTASTDGGTTTGSNQQLTYQTASVNLNSTERSATVTVKAGEITKDVMIKQAGSTFIVDKTEIELESSGTSGSVQVTGTEGLPWTVSPSATINDITPATTSYTATGSAQALTFNATQNSGGEREATFTVAVTGGDHSKTVKVKQKAGRITLTIDQSVLNSYKSATPGFVAYPPFDYNGSNRLPNGCIYNGSAITMTGSYTIQVQKGQKDVQCNYSVAQSYCSGLNEDGLSGWRIPTNIEWHAISKKKDVINNFSGASELAKAYWGSSACSTGRSRYSFEDNTFSWNNMVEGVYFVRCVRDY